MSEGKIVPVKITCGLIKKKMDECGRVIKKLILIYFIYRKKYF